MPFFEYRCNDCKGKFEIFTMANKPDNTSCTLCKSNRTHKIISPAGIIFRGSGFYINDSKKSSQSDTGKECKNDKVEI